jgi:nitrite reductase/ring-hydroxylating ferredoxin subunit
MIDASGKLKNKIFFHGSRAVAEIHSACHNNAWLIFVIVRGRLFFMGFTKVGSIQEIPPGKAKPVTVNGRKIAVFNINGSFYAIEDQCTHRGAPLSEGECEGTEVICPWHGARFDLSTGSNLCPPAPRGVAAYKVQVVGDEVQVDIG